MPCVMGVIMYSVFCVVLLFCCVILSCPVLSCAELWFNASVVVRLLQILSNIVSNAIKYTDTGFVEVQVNHTSHIKSLHLTSHIASVHLSRPHHIIGSV